MRGRWKRRRRSKRKRRRRKKKTTSTGVQNTLTRFFAIKSCVDVLQVRSQATFDVRDGLGLLIDTGQQAGQLTLHRLDRCRLLFHCCGLVLDQRHQSLHGQAIAIGLC